MGGLNFLKSNLFDPIIEALAIELGDYQPVSDLEQFSKFTEGYNYRGDIFFTPTNLIFTNKEDYQHCLYYNQKGPVLELTLPTYEFSIYILSMGNSRLLKDAINYKSDEFL